MLLFWHFFADDRFDYILCNIVVDDAKKIVCCAAEVPIIIYEMVHFLPFLMNKSTHTQRRHSKWKKARAKFNLMRHMCAQLYSSSCCVHSGHISTHIHTRFNFVQFYLYYFIRFYLHTIFFNTPSNDAIYVGHLFSALHFGSFP